MPRSELAAAPITTLSATPFARRPDPMVADAGQSARTICEAVAKVLGS